MIKKLTLSELQVLFQLSESQIKAYIPQFVEKNPHLFPQINFIQEAKGLAQNFDRVEQNTVNKFCKL